jgi:hypothetical protein
MEKWETIKVDKKIKPIHFFNRTPVELVVGNEYYVSFGSNEVKRCKLIEIRDGDSRRQIVIEVPVKPQSEKGFKDLNGNISHHWVDSYTLFADEIGLTPEEAVVNEVTL